MSDSLIGPLLPGESSEIVGPLLPGGDILVHPMGKYEPRLLATEEGQKWAPHYKRDSDGAITVEVQPPVVMEWVSGPAIGGPRDGNMLGSFVRRVEVPVNSAGWNATYVWDKDCWRVIMSDPPVGEERPVDPVRDHVDAVIKDLGDRKVSASDRTRLRGAVDRADKAQEGRAGADSALGKAIGRSSQLSIGFRNSV